ncbi:ABC transporter permease subunit [Rhodobacterales bacterium]|nr:ABC transporter permease subunit [Rhodobacterales bacterium]
MMRRTALDLPLLLLPGVGFLILTFGLPLYWAISGSLGLGANGTGFTLMHLADIFLETKFRKGLMMSLYYSIAPTILTLFVAIPLAMLLQKSFPGRKLFNGLYKIPLAIPSIVAAFMVLTLIEQGGFMDRAMMHIGLSMPKIVRDQFGIGVILSTLWKDIPFMTLIIAGAFGAIPKDMVPAARSLGASRVRAFLMVELPLAMPGVTAATLLCFVKSIGNFAAPSLLGPAYPLPLSIQMYDAYLEGDWIAIYSMGTVLIIVSFLVLGAYYALTARTLQHMKREG